MSANNPYAGHARFYLLDLWAGRDRLDAAQVTALREEMGRRGLSPDETIETGAYRDPAPASSGTTACPVCAAGMTTGEVLTHGGPLDSARLGVHAYFRGAGGDESVVIRHGKARPALLCEECGTVVVTGRFAG